MGIAAMPCDIVGEPGDTGADLADDPIHPGFGRQGVAERGDIDAMRQRSLGDEGEIFLLVHLPIAAMDEYESWRRRRRGEEEIELGARRIAVGNVHRCRVARPHPLAARRPIRPIARRVGDRRTVIVGGIERRPVHPAIEHPIRFPL